MKTNSTSIKTPTALRVLAFFELALIAVTWRLWSDAGDVPRVPLLNSVFLNVVFFVASALLVVGCVLMLLGRAAGENLPAAKCSGGILPPSPMGYTAAGCRRYGMFSSAARRNVSCLAKYRSIVAWITWIAGCTCAMGNQQCLQAWHWLFLLSLGLWLLTEHVAWPDLMQHVLCTIYVCSALSRLTLSPETGMTAVLSRQLLQWAGVSEFRQADLLPGLCHELSIGELLIGVLLLFRRTRPLGIVAAEVLHVTLLLLLGPLGLNHHAGVLIWNMCLIVLVPIVFRRPDRAERVSAPSDIAGTRCARSGLQRAIVTSIIWLWPLSGLFGFADNWPSWQLYSNRPEMLVLSIDAKAISSLPPSLQSHVEPETAFSSMQAIRLDRWSLEQTGSPIYPEDRFQLAIIAWCVEQLPEAAEFEVRISEPDPIFWWRRRDRTLKTREELNAERQNHWLPSQANRR